MADYDPQKRRRPPKATDDEPAPVDALLGPERDPSLGAELGTPTVTARLPEETAGAATDGPAETAGPAEGGDPATAEAATGEAATGGPVAPEPEPEPELAAAGAPHIEPTPAAGLSVTLDPPPRRTLLPATAAVAAVVALLLLLLARRRRRS